MAMFTKVELLHVFLLSIVTLGFYGVYWSVITKRELNRAGAHVPNAILMIIPFANIYFWYRYAQGYASIVKKTNRGTETFAYFLLAGLPGLSGGASLLLRIVFGSGLHGIGGAAVQSLLTNFSHMLVDILPAAVVTHQIVVFSTIMHSVLVAASIMIFQEGYNNYQN